MAEKIDIGRRRSISPPPLKSRRITAKEQPETTSPRHKKGPKNIIRSPFQLTKIRDLPESDNKDAVTLQQLLGDEAIFECWQFNYCFDEDFLVSSFHPLTKDQVTIKVVHGSWQTESPNRQRIEEAAKSHANVEVIKAWVPDTYGTHHTKMMIIFRTDDTAQVIIHTANILAQDWTNLCQGVWKSPRLPLLDSTEVSTEKVHSIGTGQRFKHDLLRYLDSYRAERTGKLTELLEKYDFSSIRAALVGSVPTKIRPNVMKSATETAWGLFGLQQVLSHISKPTQGSEDEQHELQYTAQISSIATLANAWISSFFTTSMHQAYTGNKHSNNGAYHIIFPSPLNIRESLDGYQSGGSIHAKIQSVAQLRQVEYMRPMLRHWSDVEGSLGKAREVHAQRSGRKRAAPHIKTYMCFSDSMMREIRWSLLTSANLSKQAWGNVGKDGQLWIQSYELGVLVWPELFSEDISSENSSRSVMIPCFKKDNLSTEECEQFSDSDTVVALRMPYDLPLRPYTATDVPWCNNIDHHEPDNYGQSWVLSGR